jgi:hypothetical protein
VLHLGAVIDTPIQAEVPSPEVALPGSFVTSPSSGLSGGATLASYPRGGARFEQSVLYRRGPAQVGFGDCDWTSFLRLTVLSTKR